MSSIVLVNPRKYELPVASWNQFVTAEFPVNQFIIGKTGPSVTEVIHHHRLF